MTIIPMSDDTTERETALQMILREVQKILYDISDADHARLTEIESERETAVRGHGVHGQATGLQVGAVHYTGTIAMPGYDFHFEMEPR